MQSPRNRNRVQSRDQQQTARLRAAVRAMQHPAAAD
jgi:hypothetical protein